jgi:SET domain-containing protein
VTAIKLKEGRKTARNQRSDANRFAKPEAVVALAKGKGRGVFASRDFARGEIIERAPVIQVSAGDAELIQFTSLGDYTFSGEDGTSLIALGYCSLYNHSRKGNSDYVSNDDCIVVVATKPIKAGEEITFDYGWDDDGLRERGIDPDA